MTKAQRIQLTDLIAKVNEARYEAKHMSYEVRKTSESDDLDRAKKLLTSAQATPSVLQGQANLTAKV